MSMLKIRFLRDDTDRLWSQDIIIHKTNSMKMPSWFITALDLAPKLIYWSELHVLGVTSVSQNEVPAVFTSADDDCVYYSSRR